MDPEEKIGKNIQQIRRRRNFTLQQLADETGFSQGYLSKVENSKKAPSVSTLIRISKALKVTMAEIFGETGTESQITVLRESEQQEMAMGGTKFGYTYKSLAPKFSNKHMHPYILVDRKKRKPSAIFQHEGEEMLYVLQGRMHFFYGDKEYIADPGDCIYFDSSIPHHGYSSGHDDAKCLMIIYNPE